MIEELREGITNFAVRFKNDTLQNRRIGMAVILFFSLMRLVSKLLEDIYLFGWVTHEQYTLYGMGTIALILLCFGKRCAACGVMLGNFAGLIAGHFLGELHYAAQLAKITPDMDEGEIGALLCCANNGAFIWLYTSLALLAAGLVLDWLLKRRAERKAEGIF